MGGKSGRKNNKKGGQAKAQQQQRAAARRSLASPGVPAASAHAPATLRDGRPSASAPATRPAAAARPDVPAPPQVHHYLDIAATRIQRWLGRTPDLRFRRGASVLLTRVTSRERWESRLPEGIRWNEEAGSVDGVISLVFDAASAGTDTEPVDVLARAARQVARGMRDMIPHCPIQAVTGTGESYAAAYPLMAKARRNGDFLVDSPPAPAELILAKPCDQCRAAAATIPDVTVVEKERKQALCAECHARFEAGGKTAGRPVQAPAPERKLRKALETAGMPVEDFSDTFADMAQAGRTDRDDASTQIALIYADGNKVGNFLTKVADTVGGPDKATIVPMLEAATLGALTQAVIDRFKGWPKPPVLVNLAGGDDLLVSVPAADAWLFTKTMLSGFTAILADEARNWPPQARETIPTLSAGVVFHGVKTPFSDAVRLAERQLRQAKAATGTGASVAFLDMTADGGEPPKGRLPITLADLDRHAGRLQQIADLSPSRRHTLLGLLRDADKAAEMADKDRGASTVENFLRRLTDFADNRPLWEIAVGPGTTPAAVRDHLRKSEASRHEVRRALDIARHWRTEPRTEPGPQGSETPR